METLKNIVQNILIIILLTTLLEMLLPEGDMRRYVRLVMGLFVIMVVLNPVLALFHSGVNLDAVSFNSGQEGGDLAAAVARGRELGERQKVQALNGLQEKVNGQVMALARLNKSINVTDVKVEMVDDPKSPDFGQIKTIIVKTGEPKEKAGNVPGSGASGKRGGDGNPGGPAERTGNGISEVLPVEIKVPDIKNPRPQDKSGAAAGSGQNGQLREILADFYGLAPERIKIVHQP